MPNSHQSQIPVCGLRHCLTCGSSGHVPVAHLSSSTTSSILVVWTIFWPKFRHALLVGDSVNRWPSSVRHLRHCSFFAVQSPWWKPSGTGHIRCLSSESKKLLSLNGIHKIGHFHLFRHNLYKQNWCYFVTNGNYRMLQTLFPMATGDTQLEQ